MRNFIVLIIAVALFGALALHLQRGKSGTPHRAMTSVAVKSISVKHIQHANRQTIRAPIDGHTVLAVKNWRLLFDHSRNYFLFVRSAATAAANGNGTAALYVSKAMSICALEIFQFGNNSNPKSAFTSWLSNQAYMPEWVMEIQREHFELCQGFFGQNAFSGLPPPKRGSYMSSSYWLNLAEKDHNSVAELMELSATWNLGEGANSAQATAIAQNTVLDAVSSGDPDAVFRAGMFLADGNSANEIRAFAVAIAGCNLGYDCSSDNALIFGECVAGSGQCPSGQTFSDVVTKAVGSSGYAKAYQMAQELQYAISSGDEATIRRFVKLRN